MRMKTKFSFHCFERVTLKYNSMQNPTTIQVQGLDELFFNVHSQATTKTENYFGA